MRNIPLRAALIVAVMAAGGLAATGTSTGDPAPPTGTDGGGGQAHAGAIPGTGRVGPNTPAARDAASAAAAAGSQRVLGIDIASYQHPNGAAINWAAVARQVRFVYLKATEGTAYVNPYYASDARAARSAGLYTGAYAFVRPEVANPTSQADKLLVAAPYTPDGLTLPPMVDIEWPYTWNGSYVAPYPCWGLSAASMVNWLRTFTARLQSRTGVRPLIYTAASWWNPCTGSNPSFGALPLTVASWTSSPTPLPAGWSQWTFWQWSASLSVAGISGAVDADWFNGSSAGLAAFAGGYWRMATTLPRADDVTGDRKGDVLAVTPDRVYALTSTGSTFRPLALWSAIPFHGRRATVTADVDGDGRADLVAANGTSTWVMRSHGSGYYPPVRWSGSPFAGARATVAADVNGDRRTDLVAVNGTSTWVMLSTGSAFSAPVRWSRATFYGVRASYPADVTGDGRADLVGVNGTSVYVMRSTGSGFAAPTPWSSLPFIGTKATVTADINGDGRADLVAVNDTSIYTMLSTGSIYYTPKLWSSAGFYGTKTTVATDLNGDKKADLVAINLNSLWTMTSGGSAYSPPANWTFG
jgi:GH25 family lysozyme M1 (1,4-beta-N-acetylmuramidase)